MQLLSKRTTAATALCATKSPLTFSSGTRFQTLHEKAIAATKHSNPAALTPSVANARNQIFYLTMRTGKLAEQFIDINSSAGNDDDDDRKKKGRQEQMIQLLLELFRTAAVCEVDLYRCICGKIELNSRKYPVELCKGRAGKYTDYSDSTGITKTQGQSLLLTLPLNNNNKFISSVSNCDRDGDNDETLEECIQRIRQFALDRNWSRYHTPRNIALALIGELGELSELFQWKGDDDDDVIIDNLHDHREGDDGGSHSCFLNEGEKDKVAQELADVSIYLLRLMDLCNIHHDIGSLC